MQIFATKQDILFTDIYLSTILCKDFAHLFKQIKLKSVL